MILSLETSTSICSVALHENGELLSHFASAVPKSHSRVITLLIDRLMNTSEIDFGRLSAIAISEGPGSYTGLRIGASTAKGLCYATGLPLIAVNTLDSMSAEMQRLFPGNRNYVPMLDARRMEVYTAVYNSKAERIVDPFPLVLDEDSFRELPEQGRTIFFGSGAEKFSAIMKDADCCFLPGFNASAAGVGYIAEEKLTNGDFVDTIYFEPFYLKEFYSTAKK